MDDDEKDPDQNQEEDKTPEDENKGANDESKPAGGEDEKKEGEDDNQIDSGTAGKPEDEALPDDRVHPEAHSPHDGSENGDIVALPNPYENDEPLMLEINSKSKSKCLKKVILEKKNLEGSQMLLFK
jgi:hypothetical protein